MNRFTYHYHVRRLTKGDKYSDIKDLIGEVYAANKRRYGYRRITSALRKEYGLIINHKTVYRLMNELGSQSRVRIKKYRSYKGEVGKIAPNILNRDFNTTGLNQKWATDVTEFSIETRKIYLSTIIDLFNREIISYEISYTPNVKFTRDTVTKALTRLKDERPILHSDQGFQYQHMSYQRLLQENHIVQSMSRKGNCLDNAMQESFFSTLKSEFYHLENIKTNEQLIQGIHEYIDWYNTKRISNILKGMTPIEYRHHALN